jgi:hypothetical protein
MNFMKSLKRINIFKSTLDWIGTLVSLFFIPLMYYLLKRKRI